MRARTQVRGINEVKKKLKDLERNTYRKRALVSAAKDAGDPMLKEMKAQMTSVDVDRSSALNKLLGKKTIPRSESGDEFPGAFIGLKDKGKFTAEASGGALNIYWIEFGTARRDYKGRDRGVFPAFAPLRRAISKTVKPAFRDFNNALVRIVNKRIKRNSL